MKYTWSEIYAFSLNYMMSLLFQIILNQYFVYNWNKSPMSPSVQYLSVADKAILLF